MDLKSLYRLRISPVGGKEIVEAALDYLKSRKEVDADNLGLIRHSEGGVVASIVAIQRPEVDFIVLLAGPRSAGRQTYVASKRSYTKEDGGI